MACHHNDLSWDHKQVDASHVSPSIANQRGKGEGGRVPGKGEGPQENWEKVQVLQICRGDGVVPSRVIQDEYRI